VDLQDLTAQVRKLSVRSFMVAPVPKAELFVEVEQTRWLTPVGNFFCNKLIVWGVRDKIRLD
jgi:hypothetical protein